MSARLLHYNTNKLQLVLVDCKYCGNCNLKIQGYKMLPKRLQTTLHDKILYIDFYWARQEKYNLIQHFFNI